MTALYSLQQVSKHYGTARISEETRQRAVLVDVTADIAAGSTVGLLGRSGSGKSTLGRLMLGFERPTAGQIQFHGTSLMDMSRGEKLDFRRQVQVVFQDSIGAVNPRHSVGRIVAEPLRHLTGLNAVERRERVAELLMQVGLRPEDAAKRPVQMSGGQLQRVCIARALAPSPQMIVLDEAVSSLDLVLQIQILNLFMRLQRETSVAYLLVTHDLRLVQKFCHRVMVLDAGQIVEDRPVEPVMVFEHQAGRLLQDAVLPALPRPRR